MIEFVPDSLPDAWCVICACGWEITVGAQDFNGNKTAMREEAVRLAEEHLFQTTSPQPSTD